MTMLLAAGSGVASACPMCKSALETDSRLPQAYQTSILFMLSVPTAIFSAITWGLVIIARRESQQLEEMNAPQANDDSSST